MPTLKAGDEVRVVEHNDATREPVEGGLVLSAVVAGISGAYVSVCYDDDRYNTVNRLDPFWADSGWRAWDGEFRWRLEPVMAGETPATEGER